MKKKAYIGRHARLRREVRTEGAVVYPKGLLVLITATWRGKFTISEPNPEWVTKGFASDLPPIFCRGVSEYDLDLLPQDPRALSREALTAAIEIAAQFGLAFEGVDREAKLIELEPA